ncbi:MAG: TatD family hydrolase [Candidatus Azobacteroides sp.]|nr:TatD family hydrolase [Candidatus Azobacteroides sp.]
MYYDLHTHKNPEENGDICAIINILSDDIGESFLPLPPPKGDSLRPISTEKHRILYPPLERAGGGKNCYSTGIHPWHIKAENIQKELDLIEKYAGLSNIKAIGECGLDKCCKTDFNLQKRVFLSQVLISEQANKPLIIHCVKSLDEMIDFKKKMQPKQPWIIHGFRGKPEQAIQLTTLGFYLSFGFNYNEESIKRIPIEKLFLETDDSDCTIQTIYQKTAKVLGISEQNLIQQIEQNILRLKKF